MSKNELLSDIFLLTPSHGRAGVRRPERIYLLQLCTDIDCCLEDLPNKRDDREEQRE